MPSTFLVAGAVCGVLVAALLAMTFALFDRFGIGRRRGVPAPGPWPLLTIERRRSPESEASDLLRRQLVRAILRHGVVFSLVGGPIGALGGWAVWMGIAMGVATMASALLPAGVIAGAIAMGMLRRFLESLRAYVMSCGAILGGFAGVVIAVGLAKGFACGIFYGAALGGCLLATSGMVNPRPAKGGILDGALLGGMLGAILGTVGGLANLLFAPELLPAVYALAALGAVLGAVFGEVVRRMVEDRWRDSESSARMHGVGPDNADTDPLVERRRTAENEVAGYWSRCPWFSRMIAAKGAARQAVTHLDYPLLISSNRKAMMIAARGGYVRGVIAAQIAVARGQSWLGRFNDAVASILEAYDLARRRDHDLAVEATTVCAEICRDNGELEQNLILLRRLDRWAGELGSADCQADAACELARHYYGRAMYREALEQYQRVVNLLRDAFSGVLDPNAGPSGPPLLLQASGQSGVMLARCAFRNNVIPCLVFLEEYDRAEALWRCNQAEVEALDRMSRTRMGDRVKEYNDLVVETFNVLGVLRYQQGRLDDALQAYEQALAHYQQCHRAAPIRRTQHLRQNIAMTLRDLGRIDEAERIYGELLDDDEAAIHPRSRWVWLLQLGILYCRSNQRDKARECLEEGLEISEQLRDRSGTMTDVRQVFTVSSINAYEELIALLIAPGGREDDEGRAFVLAEQCRARSLLELFAERDVAFSADDPGEALSRRERELQRELAVVCQRVFELQGRDRGAAALTSFRRRREQLELELESLRAEIRAKSPRYADLRYPEPLTLDQVQQDLLTPGEVLLEYFISRRGCCVWAVRPDHVECYRLDASAQELAERIEGELRAPLTDPSGRRAGDERSDEVDDRARRIVASARSLYETLIAPAESMLHGARRVLVSPDGPLHYLPFEALVVDEHAAAGDNGFSRSRFWCEQLADDGVAISYVPSASVLASIRRTAAESESVDLEELIAFGDPDFEAETSDEDDLRESPGDVLRRTGFTLKRLPATEREVRDIFALFDEQDIASDRGHASDDGTARDLGAVVPSDRPPARDRSERQVLVGKSSRAYFGAEASETRARRECGNYRYVHFATHGLLDESNPMYSGVAFSPTAAARDPEGDWLLQTHEIFGMKLHADLVTLSACQTGLGKLTRGEGLVGMTRAFMFAGTPSALVSLWSVDDNATAVFMVDFYRRLRAGTDKATALMETRRMMLTHPDHPHYRDPFYWAAFVLQGEGRGETS